MLINGGLAGFDGAPKLQRKTSYNQHLSCCGTFDETAQYIKRALLCPTTAFIIDQKHIAFIPRSDYPSVSFNPNLDSQIPFDEKTIKMATSITEISTPLHFRTLMTRHTCLIADFYATWCPPCRAIAPTYEQLSQAHSIPGKVCFVRVNVDEQQEVAVQNGIQAMPTFMVFKDGKKVNELKGANPPALRNLVERAAAEAMSANVQERAAEPNVQERAAEPNVQEKEAEPKVAEEPEEEKTVSGSYGMTSNNSWKMSLN